MKYILVTGGVISGLGKGVIVCSLGTLLQNCGIPITCIKVDPYINIDAGMFSPLEHGEVFVLDDGSEVDLDMGNYERFLDVTLSGDNNITTGKVFQRVIEMEREGKYLGKTVQVVPHVTNIVKDWIKRTAKKSVTKNGLAPKVCIIELGGTIDDIECLPFVEAFRQFQFEEGNDNFCCAHVVLVPNTTCEFKTKPTQTSVKTLRSMGLSPDIIFCRSEIPLAQGIMDKIKNFCQVESCSIVNVPDLSDILKVPAWIESQRVVQALSEKFQLPLGPPLPGFSLDRWEGLIGTNNNILTTIVTISLVGKYTILKDAYLSVAIALQYACLKFGFKLNLQYIESANLEIATKERDPKVYDGSWQMLRESDGVVVPGGFDKRGLEGIIEACFWCRTNDVPFLGICLGFQMAVVEFARNVLNLPDANSTEVDPNTTCPIIVEMPEFNQSVMGGTMRLGKKKTIFRTDCKSTIRALYDFKVEIEERHRHRYEVNTTYIDQLEQAGLMFVGRDEEFERMEIFELKGLKYYVATQFHPEFLSRPFEPSPPYVGLIAASAGILKMWLQ